MSHNFIDKEILVRATPISDESRSSGRQENVVTDGQTSQYDEQDIGCLSPTTYSRINMNYLCIITKLMVQLTKIRITFPVATFASIRIDSGRYAGTIDS
jgi:hypothetical protein